LIGESQHFIERIAMKIIVFGASGSVGRLIVDRGLEMGHLVTAFSRHPEKTWPSGKAGLSVIQGDALDPAAVRTAISGQDAVLCTLGAGAAGKVRAAGTANIVDAMRLQDVRRLICQTTLGVGESWSNLNFFWKHLMFGLLLRQAYTDHVKQEAIIAATTLDWTIVRPSAFTDGASTSNVKQGFPATEHNLKLSVARIEVASFMLAQLSSTQYLRRAVGLSH
jgi:uncharacterized protein YbjT (DUF2867 family)